jgi:hypothetical protein
MHASGVVTLSGPTTAPVTVRADESAEPNAATVVASAPAELPALTERQFSTTQKSPLSAAQPSSDGTGLVIGVAAAALFIGIISGVLLLRNQRNNEADQHRALPAPEPVAVHQPSEPKVKQKAAPTLSASASASVSSDRPLLEFLPGDAPSGSAAPAPAPVEPKVNKTEPPASAPSGAPHAAPSTSLPDGGWVKPAWAIPDGEPVRRAPITE